MAKRAGGQDRQSGLRKVVTVADVAARAGVSVGTVSNVLNGRVTVREERRQRVVEAIEALGFRQSVLAKAMRQQRYPLVGLCVPHTSFANFAAVADVLESRVASADFQMVQMISRHDPALELARINSLVQYRASGVILVPSSRPDAALDRLHAAGMPTVILNRAVPSEARFDQVTVDHRAALFGAAREMFAWGHRHLMLAVQHPGLSVTEQRLEGLKEAAGEFRGGRVSVLDCGFDEAAFGGRFARAVKGKAAPTVVIASNSVVAAWIIKAMRAQGIACPDDVSLLVVEEPDWAEAATPQLSCIRQPTREIVELAWSRLRERIEGGDAAAATLRCEAEIVFRQSVAKR